MSYPAVATKLSTGSVSTANDTNKRKTIVKTVIMARRYMVQDTNASTQRGAMSIINPVNTTITETKRSILSSEAYFVHSSTSLLIEDDLRNNQHVRKVVDFSSNRRSDDLSLGANAMRSSLWSRNIVSSLRMALPRYSNQFFRLVISPLKTFGLERRIEC
jgi:hypothetical protein